jgi:hypothetical protein
MSKVFRDTDIESWHLPHHGTFGASFQASADELPWPARRADVLAESECSGGPCESYKISAPRMTKTEAEMKRDGWTPAGSATERRLVLAMVACVGALFGLLATAHFLLRAL